MSPKKYTPVIKDNIQLSKTKSQNRPYIDDATSNSLMNNVLVDVPYVSHSSSYSSHHDSSSSYHDSSSSYDSGSSYSDSGSCGSCDCGGGGCD